MGRSQSPRRSTRSRPTQLERGTAFSNMGNGRRSRALPNYPPELDPEVAHMPRRGVGAVLSSLASRLGIDVYDPAVAGEQSGLPQQPRSGLASLSAERKDEPGALSDIGEW